MGDELPLKKRWKIQPNGKGIPLSVFDVPNEEEEEEVKNGNGRISPLVTNGIAIVVTVMWAASFTVDIISMEYTPPTAIHVAFMAVIGAIFGFQLVKGKDQ